MLFNSYSFLFLFLPVTVLGFVAVSTLQVRRLSLAWLVLCSLVFYGAWNPINLAIIPPSIAINYGLAACLRRQLQRGEAGERLAGWLLSLGIVFNLCFLGYFKYKNFFIDSANEVFGTDWPLYSVFLPLGISFITFQKIAFLADVRAGTVKDFKFFDFLTFVFFFPQLIAGPIVHYGEMMPQFEQIRGRLDARNLAIGICLFVMGLFKKVMIADNIAPYASPIFAAAAHGEPVTFFNAWMGALAYTFQVYFDFSGYSDMALGLARIFGIRLPVNFNSPLKSSSIIEFWSRWHITLSRFLSAYVYMPIHMALMRLRMRQGKSLLSRRNRSLSAYLALIAGPTVFTMLLSGLWHGAGVTFLAWGGVHGILLAVNQAWRQWRPAWDKDAYDRIMKPLGFAMTFFAVTVAMVLFRADSMAAAGQIYHGMAGINGVSLPQSILHGLGRAGEWLLAAGVVAEVSAASRFAFLCAWLLVLFLVATRAPNTLDLMRNFDPALHFKPPAALPPGPAITTSRRARSLEIRWDRQWALAMAALFVIASLGLSRPSEFLYWQF